VVAAAGGGFDQLRQHRLGYERLIVLDHRQGTVDRRLELTGAQVRQCDDAPADIGLATLASGGRLADLSQSCGARPRGLAATCQHEGFAAVVDVQHSGVLAGGHELVQLSPSVLRLIETAG